MRESTVGAFSLPFAKGATPRKLMKYALVEPEDRVIGYPRLGKVHAIRFYDVSCGPLPRCRWEFCFNTFWENCPGPICSSSQVIGSKGCSPIGLWWFVAGVRRGLGNPWKFFWGIT